MECIIAILHLIGKFLDRCLKTIDKKNYKEVESQNIRFNENFLTEEKKRVEILNEELKTFLISLLKVEKFPFCVLNEDVIKIENLENDYLIATSHQGIKYLDFMQNNYKDEGFNSIFDKTMLEVHFPLEDNPLLQQSCVNLEPNLVPVKKPLILEIPKCIKKEITSPKDIQKMFQDIKGIVELFYIKDFSLDNIFYVESKDKYIIGIFQEFVPLNRNVEIDLVQFLYNGNIYKYKGMPLSFEEHLSMNNLISNF